MPGIGKELTVLASVDATDDRRVHPRNLKCIVIRSGQDVPRLKLLSYSDGEGILTIAAVGLIRSGGPGNVEGLKVQAKIAHI